MWSFLLFLIIFIESGFSPLSFIWSFFAINLLNCSISLLEIWIYAIITYIINGLFLELYPIKSTHSLELSFMMPQIVLNLSSTFILTLFTLDNFTTSAEKACYYLLIAGIGNELIYAPIHRILHTRKLYKYHHLHHTQRIPRALGAIYCSLVEMWIANISSFILPLYFVRAPAIIFLIWIVSGIQTTQLHHSGKYYWWCFGNQPKFHHDHHFYITTNYGNLGFMEKILK